MPHHEPAGFRVGDLSIDLGTRQVSRDGRVLPLPKLSFDLLVALARGAPYVLSAGELMEAVWAGRVVNEETVAKRVELVRESLGDDSRSPRYITLVRGHGYRQRAAGNETKIATSCRGYGRRGANLIEQRQCHRRVARVLRQWPA